MPDDELEVRVRGVQERKEAYEVEDKRLEADVTNYDRQKAILSSFTAVSEQVRDKLQDLSEDERTELIRAFVTRITVGKDVEVSLVIPAPQGKQDAKLCL